MEQADGEKDDVDTTQANVNDKFKKSRVALSERQAELEEVAQKADELNNSLNDVAKTTDEVAKEFEPKLEAPVPKDPKQIKEAIDEVDEALEKLNNANEELQKDYKVGDWFIEQSKRDPVTTHEVQSRLESAQEPLDKTTKDLNEYKAKLVAAQHDQQALDEKVAGFTENLDKLDKMVADLSPVSALFTVGRSQQEELKVRANMKY